MTCGAVRFSLFEPTAEFEATTIVGATAPNILTVIGLGIKLRIAAILGDIEFGFKLSSLSEGSLPF